MLVHLLSWWLWWLFPAVVCFLVAFCCFGWSTNIWHCFICVIPWVQCTFLQKNLCLILPVALHYQFTNLGLLGINLSACGLQNLTDHAVSSLIFFQGELGVWIPRAMFFVFYSESETCQTSFLSPFADKHIFLEHYFTDYNPPRVLVYREASDPTLHLHSSKTLFSIINGHSNTRILVTMLSK